MRACVSLFSLLMLLAVLGGCGQHETEFGFRAQAVEIRPAYESIQARLTQEISLSQAAVEAIEHGVPLTLSFDLRLHDAPNLSLLASERFEYEIRYLPLSDRYQLTGPDGAEEQSFMRLRHAMAALSRLDVRFDTGALAPGEYELRSRMYIDNRRLPAPMRLPALLSAGWQHQSEWSAWPFVINA
jgi:hypothetical protein